VFRLEPLTDDEVSTVVEGARWPTSAGWPVQSSWRPRRRPTCVDISGGDARAALNVLEAAAAMRSDPGLEEIEAAAQQRVLAYDRAGDGHYDTVSAFIKSLRGNDPDAALYWLATMIAAGEDPRFIAGG
jgi:putative ATPase